MVMNFISLSIPFLPLLASLLLLFFGKKLHIKKGEPAIEAIGISFTAIAFIFSISAWLASIQYTNGSYIFTTTFAHWVSIGRISLDWAFYISPLTLVMALVVTGVGSLILIYASAYMHNDPSFWRFYLYMNLFLTAMLIFIFADNLLVAFVGWEGIGVCSYLLVGFWFHKKENATAGRKAFVVNRLGDLGFLSGMLLLLAYIPGKETIHLNYAAISKQALLMQGQTIYGIPLLELISFCFLIAALGKSAQIPLYIWLPDAMAGPTPVSALIHAATMVTAGIYLIIHLFPIFYLAPVTLEILGVIAAISCLYAAFIACFQWDIKRVLAYSTMSQLSYMFLALSIGSLKEGLFHLVTHASFKALLFMGAGSIITSLHHEQDIRNMGGLYKKMPFVAICFIIATLAITGFPFTAGFFSKDAILEQAWKTGHYGLWFAGFLGAGMTAFYMWRVVFITFFAKPKKELHVTPVTMRMKIPMGILAFSSLFLGWVNDSHHTFNRYLSSSVPNFLITAKTPSLLMNTELLNIITMLLTFIAFIVAFFLYIQWKEAKPTALFAYTGNRKGLCVTIGRMRRFAFALERFFAQTVPYVIMQIFYSLARLAAIFDFYLIRNAFDEIGRTVSLVTEGLQELQFGNMKSYVLVSIVFLSMLIISSILFL